MDILDFLAIMIPVVLIGILGFKWIGMADQRARIEMQKRLAKTRDSRSAPQRRQQPQEPEEEIGSWVPALLESFGVDPEVLFNDEMPPELKTFLPVIKGYINAQGGLGGIAQAISKGTDKTDHKAI